MGLLYIQNLALIVTEECNVNCAHCMRGEKSQVKMSKEVIDATFSDIAWVGNLNICGGEPTMAVDVIKYIIELIIKKGIIVEAISIAINGTIYSKELLDTLNDYVKYAPRRLFRRNKVLLSISLDEYHAKEYQRLGLEKDVLKNIGAYARSKFFYDFRRLNYNIFNDGNAVNLDVEKVDMIPHLPVITYVYEKHKRDECAINIGPLVTIASDGTITEENTSFEKQKTIYNYGNVLDGRIDEQLITAGARVIDPEDFDNENEVLLLKFVKNEK